MITEEEIKLILNTQDSTSQVHKLAEEVARLNEYLRDLAQRYNEGAISQQQYAQYADSANDVLREKSALLEDVARKVGALEGSESGGGMKGLNQSIMQAGYAVQDFTSQIGTRGLGGALLAVSNNIPGILTGLGAGAGLTGVISALSVGLGAALPKIQEFFSGIDPEKVKAAAEELKKLGAAGEKIGETKTKPEEDEAKAIQEGLKAAGGRALKGGFMRLLAERDEAAAGGALAARMATPEVRAELQYGGPLIREQVAERERRAISEESARTLEERAQRMLSEASTAAGFGSLVDQAKARPDLFGAETAGKLIEGRGAPERQAKRKREEARQKAEDARIEAQGEAEDAAAKEAADASKKELEARRKRWEHRQKVEDAGIEQQADEEDRAEERAKKDAKHAADLAKRAADKAAHDRDPSVMARREREGLEDRARTMAAGMEGPMGWRPNRNQFDAMVRDAVGNMPMGGGQAELAQAIQQAALAGYHKAMREMARQVDRGATWSESRE